MASAARNRENRTLRDINPGFFDLYLNITQSGIDGDQIRYLKGEQELELKTAHESLHPVIKNAIAMLLLCQPHGRNEARQSLEAVSKTHPKHLNTLANLCHVYRLLRRSNDVDRCKNRIDEILEDETEDAQKEKGRCLLEQGYMTIIDFHAEVKESPVRKLTDVYERLQTLQKSHPGCSAIQRQRLEETTKNILSCRQKLMTLPENFRQDDKTKYLKAVQQLEKGLSLLQWEKQTSLEPSASDITPLFPVHHIWEIELGRAYMRLGNNESGEGKQNAFDNAAQNFICGINGLSRIQKTENKKLVHEARGLAYLAYVWKTKINFLSPSSIEQVEHLGVLERITRLDVEDRVVYNRCGLRLIREKRFIEAEKCFEDSVKKWPDYNWFAYSCQLELYNARYRNEPNPSFLEKAIFYGKECLKWRSTTFILWNLAHACYKLSQVIKCTETSKSYVHQAIDYLHRAIERHDCHKEPRVYTLYGQCLLEIGEKKDAIEMINTAIRHESVTAKITENFSLLFTSMLHFYETKSEDLKFQTDLSRQLWCLLGVCYRKHGKSMSWQLTGLANNFPHHCIDLIKRMTLTERGKATKFIVKTCMKTLEKHNGKRVRERAAALGTSLPLDLENYDDCVRDPEEQLPIELEIDNNEKLPLLPHKFKFDFFVSHSHKDKDWVKYCLLKELEGGESNPADYSCGFRGCYADRDFIPGNTITQNIQNAITHSYKVIVVLTKQYVVSDWCKYELDTTLRTAIDEKSRNECLIPVLYEQCDIPESIKTLTHLDFTGKTCDWDKLTAVLSETPLD